MLPDTSFAKQKILANLHANPKPAPRLWVEDTGIQIYEKTLNAENVVSFFANQAQQSGVNLQFLAKNKISTWLDNTNILRTTSVDFMHHPLLANLHFTPHSFENNHLPTAVTCPVAAIAETGTLMFNSLLVPSYIFLATHLICFIEESSIYPRFEDALKQINTKINSLHYITGPSRTADIEQTLQIGAHGPVSMDVCILQ